MEIDNTECLLRTIYTGYEVKPYKYMIGSSHALYQCDDENATVWGVMTMCGEFEQRKIAQFKDQYKAHQFAELLTECLTKIKSFTHETNQ